MHKKTCPPAEFQTPISSFVYLLHHCGQMRQNSGSVDLLTENNNRAMSCQLAHRLHRQLSCALPRTCCAVGANKGSVGTVSQLRHLALCPSNQQQPLRLHLQHSRPRSEQRIMATRSTALAAGDFALLKQVALQAAETGAEVCDTCGSTATLAFALLQHDMFLRRPKQCPGGARSS